MSIIKSKRGEGEGRKRAFMGVEGIAVFTGLVFRCRIFSKNRTPSLLKKSINLSSIYIYILIYSMVLYGFLMLCSTTKFASPVLGANAYNHHILWPIRSWVSHPQWYCILDAVCCSLWVGPRPRLVPEYHTEVATTEEANMEAATKVGQHTEAPELVMDPSCTPNIALQLDEFGYFDVIAEMASSK